MVVDVEAVAAGLMCYPPGANSVRCRRESVFHLGFTGLVQLRDGLFQLFVGGKL